MKTIKMLIVSGIVATTCAYAQDGGKQTPQKEESKPKSTHSHAQEVTIKQKSSNVKTETKNTSNKGSQPAEEPKKQEVKKATEPKK